MKKYIILALLLTLFIGLNSQVQDWIWAQRGGGTDSESSQDIAIDSNGNLYIVGSFGGTGSTATFGSFSITSLAASNAYVAKLSPSGVWQWAKLVSSTTMHYGNGITVDSNGNCFVTGRFGGTASFGSTNLTTYGSSDAFIAKLDSNGNWLWAKKAGGTSADYAYSVSTDMSGNCYLCGFFQTTASFGSISLTCDGYYDGFVAKLDGNGNWLWAKQVGGSDLSVVKRISTDASGNCLCTGDFYTLASFGTINLTSTGNLDIFVAKL
jgi:hypothetical protein